MAYMMTLVLLSLLCIRKATTAAINGTTTEKDSNLSVEEVAIDFTESINPYSNNNNNNNNFTLNASIFEFTTVTMTKRRHRIKFERPPGPPSSAFLDVLDQYAMPIAICLGILGNVIMFPIFVYTPLKGNALSHYLAAMGVSDFLYLVSCLIVWTSKQGLTVYQTIGVCQLTQFFLRISKFLSTWYLFAAHVERLFDNFRSFRTTSWCSKFSTKFIIIFIFIFSLVGFLHYIWTHVLVTVHGRVICSVMMESFKHLIRLGKIELIAATFLPMFLFVLIDAALCINTIAKRYKLYFRVPSKSGYVIRNSGQDDLGDYALASHRRSGFNPNSSRESNSPPPEFDLNLEKRSTTLVVMICGLIFIGLLLPNAGFTLKMYFMPASLTANEMKTTRLFEHLVEFNSVYKFLLYLVLLRPFRKGLVYLFKCRSRKNTLENSFQETTEV